MKSYRVIGNSTWHPKNQYPSQHLGPCMEKVVENTFPTKSGGSYRHEAQSHL
jgi:hypothetical protein